MLTEAEYTAAQTSALNAHYASPAIIRTIYRGLDNLGFHRGSILESSCGIGNFFEMLLERMQTSHLFAVELDGITGRIGSLGDVPSDGRILLP